MAHANGLPVIVYNNPIAYGVDISPQIFAQLEAEATLVAIKESSGDVRRITDLFNTVGNRYIIFMGQGARILSLVLATPAPGHRAKVYSAH